MRLPGAAILCYHAITSAECPSDSVVNIPFEEVTSSLEQLRADREIVPLSEVLRRHANGQSVAGLAAITFDDAYASLGVLLAPWLRAKQIPYSVFVTTQGSSTGAPFWWDRVDDTFPHVAPAEWSAFEHKVGMPEEYRVGHAAAGPRRALRQYILATFRGRWPSRVAETLAELEVSAGMVTTQRPMTFSELDALAGYDGVEIGIHTETHPVLPLLPDSELIAEVRNSFDQLRVRYRNAIPVLAIPFGLFDARTLRLASQAGAEFSLTLTNRLMGFGERSPGTARLSMTRHSPVWKQRLRWSGAVQSARDVLHAARRSDPFPALPSPVS